MHPYIDIPEQIYLGLKKMRVVLSEMTVKTGILVACPWQRPRMLYFDQACLIHSLPISFLLKDGEQFLMAYGVRACRKGNKLLMSKLAF